MGNMIDRFEQDSFPAKKRQPYYYDELGNLKKVWYKEITDVKGKSDVGMHKQPGFVLHLKYDDDDGSPRHVVYGGANGEVPKIGDTLKFHLNEEVSKELDYPAYSVILEQQPTFFGRLLSRLGISK